jgi:cytochrome P450
VSGGKPGIGHVPELSAALFAALKLLSFGLRRPASIFDAVGERFEGTMVFVAPCVAHRLPEVFPDPHSYRPDRWVGRTPDPFELISFGAGLHRGPGRDVAREEMKVVLALMLRHLDLELLDADPPPVLGPRAKWPASPCRVRYRRRPREIWT